jgi:hypothetical protein
MTRGQPDTRRERHEYDGQQRRTAALVQRDHPSWLIMYGPWSRRFWAYSAFATRHGRTIVFSEPDPSALAAHLRDAEAAHRGPARRT